MKRNAAGLLLTLLVSAGARASAAPAPEAALSAPEIEETTAIARRAADALGRQSEPVTEKLFDESALIARAAGTELAGRLTPRQRRTLGDRMIAWISAPFAARPRTRLPAVFLAARPDGADAVVSLLVPVASGYLKSDWRLRRAGPEWKVEDVVLSDLGRSLRDEAVAVLGPPPIARPRDRRREGRRAAWPRIVGFLAAVVVAVIFARRAGRRERRIVFAAAAAPALLFLADGYLAVSRVWKEPIELELSDGPAWQYSLQQFQLAVSRRNRPRARAAAADAISRGARPQPLHLVLGRMAEEASEAAEARSAYARALAPPNPAPGGWAGLARLDSVAGRDAEAVQKWERYFAAVTPDSNSLFWLAVAQGHLHDYDIAQATIARAIEISPAEPDLYALSAKLYGAAGDAKSAIARLREEENLAALDRRELSADGNFAPLAEDGSWKAFLAEPPRNGADAAPEVTTSPTKAPRALPPS